MKTIIYYFSGTGNSLHAAREIAERMPGTVLVPIVSLLKKDRIDISGERIGFIYPVYVNSVPIQVQKFLKKIEFGHTEYIFSIVTHGGYTNLNIPRRTLQRLLTEKGKDLDGFYDLLLTSNSPTGIMPTFIPGVKKWVQLIQPEIVQEKEIEMQKAIDRFQDKIIEGKRSILHSDDGIKVKLFDRFINTFPEDPKRKISYYCDPTCTGCGTCEKVCLSGTIKMVDGKPTWQEEIDCFHCYACFNFCPEQAILVKNWKLKNGRYHHPKITADDIASQK
jgi:ferredoxin/flavodoxin